MSQGYAKIDDPYKPEPGLAIAIIADAWTVPPVCALQHKGEHSVKMFLLNVLLSALMQADQDETRSPSPISNFFIEKTLFLRSKQINAVWAKFYTKFY